MKRGGGKRKANNYERSIGRLFTAAYYPDGSGEFQRPEGSGGRDKRIMPGDLVAFKYVNKNTEEMIFDRSFPFLLECKNWNEENVKHFYSGLYSKESQIWEWIEQASNDAKYKNQIPLVVFKLTFGKDIVILRTVDFNKIQELFGYFPGRYYTLKKWSLAIDNKTPALTFCLLSNFLSWVDWAVYRLAEQTRYLKSLMKVEGDG